MHHGFTVRTLCRVDPLYIAVMVTVTGAPTAVVVTVKFGEVVPVATVTDAGTAAIAGLSLMSVTTAPAAAAAAVSVTRFPVVESPPFTDVGERVSADSASGFTTSVSVFETPL